MAKWSTLLLALMATALIFVSTSAAKPIRLMCTEVPDDDSGDISTSDKPNNPEPESAKHSVQILLSLANDRDYNWILFQGPAKIPVSPCPTYPKPFEAVSMSPSIHYPKDTIKQPPGPPAMSLDMDPWDGRTNCKWVTTGGNDAGLVQCDDYASSCAKDGQFMDGPIYCQGVFFHRAFACEF
ncbi:hypothetical protein PtrSN002B_001214 [Pyrenophora tritici-repentis]|nr:hypothetical protein PtrV1_00622 [Pyrenophora tritici-repentis]KAF7453336.1 hypothetical protein A1F99_005940 [Pyrenophora tritici-repentis]KAF7576398.1 Atrophin-1 multi-domain protein [Pyrenophora tritici-repentis]KAG9377215.1 hypothetical protein A1F94_011618 [Pyrenophora tritici-repentis]KAI0578012.1 hypothetical protein Alg215_06580 [Pyrenophora tritici-repentis]